MFEVFVVILLVTNISLNQTLLILLLYAIQIWNTHLFVSISLWGIVFLKFKTILLLLSVVMQFMGKRNCILHVNCPMKIVVILIHVFTRRFFIQRFTSFSVIDLSSFLWAQLSELIYIFLIVNISSSVNFELLVPLPLFIEITSFVFTNRKDLVSKAKFKEANNRGKWFLKLITSFILMKQKSLTWNLPIATFGKMLLVVSTKINMLLIPYIMVSRLSSASDKAKL